MALNLGPQAFEAVQSLRNNNDWRAFTDALQGQMSAMMHTAIECPVENRQDATGYARALRDVVATIAQMELAKPGHMPRPQVRMREKENV